MIRFLALIAAAALLGGCSMLHLGNGNGLDVVGKSQYCGTESQDSEVHYFADPDAFQDWIEYRSISEFHPSMAKQGGLIVVEMGQRPTGGYKIKLDRKKSGVADDTLTVSMDWHAPRLDAAVSQALTAECVALRPPKGRYDKVRVLDQLGNIRGEAPVQGHGG